MDALSHLESLVEIGLAAAAVLLALGSALRSLRTAPDQPNTGELVWALVAMLVLAAVGIAAGTDLRGVPGNGGRAAAGAAVPAAGDNPDV